MNLSESRAALICILAGYVMGRAETRAGTLRHGGHGCFMPALVFDALLTADVSLTEMLSTGVASGFIIALLFVFCLIARPMVSRPMRDFALPVLFMNAGFLGMPLMILAFGPEGLGRIVVFDQVQSFFMFTLGIWIAAPRHPSSTQTKGWARFAFSESLAAFIREPLMYAILAAVTLRALNVTLWESVLHPYGSSDRSRGPGSLALGLRLAQHR